MNFIVPIVVLGFLAGVWSDCSILRMCIGHCIVLRWRNIGEPCESRIGIPIALWHARRAILGPALGGCPMLRSCGLRLDSDGSFVTQRRDLLP